MKLVGGAKDFKPSGKPLTPGAQEALDRLDRRLKEIAEEAERAAERRMRDYSGELPFKDKALWQSLQDYLRRKRGG
jgi:hypothetical protein